jgi:1-phosphofructokinase
MPGVVTLTPAPSIDRSYFVDVLVPGAVHRATDVTEEFAGKGVNVSHALHLAGTPTTSVVPLPVAEWPRRSDRAWLTFSDTTVSPRVSITILEPGGQTTKINQGAPDLSPDDWSAFVTAGDQAIDSLEPQWVALCGALPQLSDASPVDVENIATRAQRAGALFALDTSGPLLATWARRGVPDLIKPNADELAECVGRDLNTVGDVLDAAREVSAWGVTYVVVSLGADGMVGVHGDNAVFAHAEPVTVVNTIGAGDASLAGFLSSLVSHPDDFAGAISQAVSWGSAKVTQPTSQLSSLKSLPTVSVETSVDRARTLSEPGRRSK